MYVKFICHTRQSGGPLGTFGLHERRNILDYVINYGRKKSSALWS
jgi:hypothetical protein